MIQIATLQSLPIQKIIRNHVGDLRTKELKSWHSCTVEVTVHFFSCEIVLWLKTSSKAVPMQHIILLGVPFMFFVLFWENRQANPRNCVSDCVSCTDAHWPVLFDILLSTSINWCYSLCWFCWHFVSWFFFRTPSLGCRYMGINSIIL